MLDAHLANLIVHVGAGIAGILIGFVLLARTKGTAAHRRLGRIFVGCTLVVALTSGVGLIAFRFIPVFAILAVLVLYQLVGGWRAARTRERGPGAFDAVWTGLAAVGAAVFVPIVLAGTVGSRVVLLASIGALVFVLSYDALRWLFPRAVFHVLWRYEHAYKMVASIFAMLSAFVGNVVRWGQPWSQVLPSILGTFVIAALFVRLYREDRRNPARMTPARASE